MLNLYNVGVDASKRVFVADEDGSENLVTMAELAAMLGLVSPKAVGQYTTVGSSTTEAVPVPGVEEGDFCFIQMVDAGFVIDQRIVSADCVHDNINVNFKGDPSNNTIINYLVFAAA